MMVIRIMWNQNIFWPKIMVENEDEILNTYSRTGIKINSKTYTLVGINI